MTKTRARPEAGMETDDGVRRGTDPQAAESEVRAALELMPQLVWTTTPDGYHDYYNQRWYDFTGMPRPGDPAADAEGWNWNRYLHPDDYKRTVRVWNHSLRTGEQYEIEYRSREQATGEYRWFLARALPMRDGEGRIVRWFGTCTDIHDGKVTLDRLRKSEERYRNSTRHSAIGHALLTPDGRFMQVNPAMEGILGRSEQQLVGLHFTQITHPEDVERGLDDVRRLAAGEIDAFEVDKRFIHASGREIWTQVNVSAVRDEAGTPLYSIAQMQDLTERHLLEERLRQAHKLEAVGRLAGGVAHDFNNLLAAIVGYADIVRSDTTDPQTHADLDEIRGAAERGARLTAQLLTFGRRHLRRVTEVDLGATVEEAAALARQLAGPHARVTIEAERNTWVHLDPSEVDQLLINLVVNARDAMPSGGELEVSVSSRDVPSPHATGSVARELEPGPYVVLSVRDSGCGIPHDVLPHIFEPFVSTKTATGGGLGLATVYGIVVRSGGTVSVETEVGKGTRISVLIPRHTAARTDTAAATGPAPMARDERVVTCTVLLVEDESPLRDVCCRILERAGHTVITARDGRDGLDCWERHEARIDLVVTDLMMPELGGRAMVAKIEESRLSIPVVFMSGYTDDEVMRRALGDSCVRFLSKPFAPAALLQAVQECVRPRAAQPAAGATAS